MSYIKSVGKRTNNFIYTIKVAGEELEKDAVAAIPLPLTQHL